MSAEGPSKKHKHMDRKKRPKIDTFQIEEQANINSFYTFDGQPINSVSGVDQVGIYEVKTAIEKRDM
jgi:hypothetical protein